MITMLALERCTGDTPQCPHYACPDGWHPGTAPNCSCTPDCALGLCSECWQPEEADHTGHDYIALEDSGD